MKIIKGYTLHPENYSKRTPVLLKKIADILLASIIVVDPVLQTIPDFEWRSWLIWGWNMFVVLFKFTTKFIADVSET
jgi:hypothetical protein